jgi:type II secretory pathway pseudopilin PulG
MSKRWPISSAQRGFTLVELMVSLTGGLFLSIVVFALARDGQRFYQRESRLANATLASISGFDRLRADIARAGYLTTPNVNADPRLCSRPDLAVPWPAQLGALRSITIEASPSVPTALANNGITPHRLLLAGSYTSSEEFPIRTLSLTAGGAQQIFLQVTSGPMARLGYLTAPAADQQALLASVFGTGRAIRMVDREGMQHYAVVANVTGGANPFITLAPNPAITLRSGAAKQCGAKGFETGATVNVVNFVRYEVASMNGNANYAQLFALSASPSTQWTCASDSPALLA